MSLNKLEQTNLETFIPFSKDEKIKTTRRISQETCYSDLEKNLKECKMSTGSLSRQNSLTQSISNSTDDIFGTDKDTVSDKEISNFDYKYDTKINENMSENGKDIFGENTFVKECHENFKKNNKNFVPKSEIINGFKEYNNQNKNSIYRYFKDSIDYYINERNLSQKKNNLSNELNVQKNFYTVNPNYFINQRSNENILLFQTLNNNNYNNSYSNQMSIEKNIKELNLILKNLNQNKFNDTKVNTVNETQTCIESQNTININDFDYSVLKNESLAKIAVFLIIDKKGCKFLQDKIQNNSHFVNNILFKYIQPYLVELCCDQYGNYFLQMLVYELNPFNLNLFIDSILNNIIKLCLSRHGSRVIQSIIDKAYQNNFLINKIIINIFNQNDKNINSNNNIFSSRHGNFVIQKLLSKVHLNENETIVIFYQYICNNFLAITNSKYGVCVVQTLYKEANEFYSSKIYQLIIKNFNEIIFNEFGCFLMRCVLTDNNSNKEIISKIEKNFENFFANKNASSVIEYCFEKDEKIRKYFLNFLVYEKPMFIIKMLKSQNGNYIIQKALCLEDSALKFEMMKVIMKNKEYLKNSGFGKKIFKKLSKNFFQYSNN